MTNKPQILFINMAKGFGGGEFYTEQLMRHLDGFECYFLGKKSGKLTAYLRAHLPHIHTINLCEAIRLALSNKSLIVHALDGRGAHFAGLFKRFFHTKSIITRQVSFPLKRKSSQKAYANADILVGVSKQISQTLSAINPNTTTIYGCLKALQENDEFEQYYFSTPTGSLKIAQIGNFQTVKNFPLTIELARQNPAIQFYLVGSGELEQDLKIQASHLNNVTFIPFTPYIGSVLKHIDLLIMPSHSEGLGMTILEAYHYRVPALAHSTGGIPEIIEHEQTGFLVSPNTLESYQTYLDKLQKNPQMLISLKPHIATFLDQHNFSAQRMAQEYATLYQQILAKS